MYQWVFEVLKKFTEVKNLGLVCKLRHAKNKCLKFQKKIVFMRVFLENNKSKIYNHTIRYRKNQFKFFNEIFNQFSVIPTTTDHG
jgi:tRNA A37 N6-isopentenylltransferase MiaA